MYEIELFIRKPSKELLLLEDRVTSLKYTER